MFKKKLIYTYNFLSKRPVYIVIAVYIITILLINPWGNFLVNDDFYYLNQIKAFRLGILKKSALISPTFILQGYLGLIWSYIFGLSYVSLRVLTIIVSILCLIFLDKALLQLNVNKEIRTLTLFLICFNPYFFASSLTFMTENYFLLLVLLSFYFFLKFISSNKNKYLLYSSIAGGLSIMIRQYGAVLLVAYLVFYLTTNKKIDYRKIIYLLIPYIVLGYLGVFYPKFESIHYPKSFDISLFFTNFESFFFRIKNISYLSYIGYFLIPFSIPTFFGRKIKTKILSLPVALILTHNIFNRNVFEVGNIFYLEGLYAKTAINIRISILNNTAFKLFLSLLISISVINIVLVLIKNLYDYLKKIQSSNITKIEGQKGLTLLLLLGFYLIVMVTDRVYDRYLLNFFVFLLIFCAIYMDRANFKIRFPTYAFSILLIIISFLLTFDYYRQTDLKWKLSEKVEKEI